MNLFACTGNLGKDARTGMAGSTPVCNFSVAVKAGYGDREQTIWIDCALWGKRAEGGIVPYLVKGKQVAVSGELGTREHEGKTYITLKVADIDLLGGRDEGGKPQQAVPTGGGSNAGGDGFGDSDIPFAQHMRGMVV